MSKPENLQNEQKSDSIPWITIERRANLEKKREFFLEQKFHLNIYRTFLPYLPDTLVEGLTIFLMEQLRKGLHETIRILATFPIKVAPLSDTGILSLA